jgi:hypothetical protein
MSTFWERFQHFLNVTDPRTLLTPRAEILEAKLVLLQSKAQGVDCGSKEEMERYRRIVSATIHPASGEIIPAPFRVSAIAPVNVPICWAMITTPASNLPGTLFLHWLNQSYNTACNYANRSGSSQPWQEVAKAYGLATVSACGLAFGMGKAFERAPPSVKRFGVLIPMLATAAANCSNIGFTRMSEITQGTPVAAADGTVLGLSKSAGMACVAQTAVTRCVLVPTACLLLPPAAMHALRGLSLVPSSARGALALELAIIYASLQAALPAALAVFPQTASFSADELEPEFRDCVDSQGRKVTTFFSNKGL